MSYYNSLERRISVLESYVIEGKRDQEILNDFLGDEYFSKYNSIKNKINDPEFKDIYRIIKKDPDEVKGYIDNFKSNRDKRISSKEMGARKLYEDSDWIVYHITDYNAAKYYGKDTKWCISGNYTSLEKSGAYLFRTYSKSNDIYFYINKHNRREKYAVLKNKNTGEINSIWDSSDTDLGKYLSYTDIELPYVEEVGINTELQEDLFYAVKDGDLDFVKDCFDKSVVNAKNARGFTPLMMAVSHSYNDIAKFLIKNGANVNAKDNSGTTSLAYACLRNDFSMVKLLVDSGADVNVNTKYGTPLTCTDNDEIKEFLIGNGAKVSK